MAKMNIRKSILINAPVDKVYESVSDFHHWTAWSPWLIMEPEAKVKVSADGKYYSWEGDRVGSGNMMILAEAENKSVDYDLNFLKPWKSNAKVSFEMTAKDGGTEVAWLMDSKLPFFLFWMKKMMEAYVGMDYERGLAMLKDYVEDGEVHSSLNFKATSNFAGCSYIGVRTECTKETMGPAMKADFEKLEKFIAQHEDLVSGTAFSIYHKWDMVKNRIAYTSGLPVKSIPAGLPADFISGTIPTTKVYTISHTGPYAHLGNAWSTLYNMQQNKAFKLNKKVDPFEIYINNPADTPAEDLVTEVHFPIR